MKKLFVVGSCRVWRPLRPYHADGTIELTNMRDPQWFTHTPRAARQFVESALGIRRIPEHLHHLIVETTPSDRVVDFDGQQAIDRSDLILVEISSLKSFDCEGFELNQHRMWGAGVKLPERLLTREDVLDDLKEIENMTGKPLVLVDHIPFAPNGEMIPGRQLITDILGSSGRAFVSKREFMRPEWLEDLNHHKQEHEAEIGRHILSGLNAA